MKKILLLLLIWLSFLLTGCGAPPARYHDQVVSTSLSNSQQNSQTRVSAAIEEWRDSGVIMEEGAIYKISAKGKWRTYPTCQFTEPDGIGLYNAWCVNSPLFPMLLDGYSHATLIARIGMEGKIIAIGNDFEFTAQDSGTLQFRINDCNNCNYDNEGYVDVKIKLQSSATQYANYSEQSNDDIETTQAIVSQVGKPRNALVIGNSNYDQSPLKNPVNDAQAMADSLQALGFNVILKLDADLEQMEQAIDDFGRKVISGNQIALFYYAGHGVQVDGENYLIPTQASINRQSDVRYKAVNIGQVLGAMGEGNDNLNIVILDACRDNPLPRSFRSSSRGLTKVAGPKGTIIGFATSPGSVASDGEGDNGVYTKHLLNSMQQPGLTIEQVFKKVLQGVNSETQGAQIPWTESSFTGDFSFLPDDN